MPALDTVDGSRKERVLERYLRERVEAGDEYFKSRHIAQDLDLSAKQIGAVFLSLQEKSALSIEKWSYTGGTTWRVSRK